MSQGDQLTILLDNLRAAQAHLEAAKNTADELGLRWEARKYIWQAGINADLAVAAIEGRIENMEYAAGQDKTGESD